MRHHFVVHDSAGTVVRRGWCTDPDHVALQARAEKGERLLVVGRDCGADVKVGLGTTPPAIVQAGPQR